MNRLHLSAALLAALSLAGCQKAAPPPNQTQSSTTATPSGPVAPDSFRVAFETGKGRFVVQVNRAWAPLGADRFYELVQDGYYDRVKFFRVLPNFIAQFGISGDSALNTKWERRIADDPVKESNRKGTLTYAMGGPNSRTTQLFINTRDNAPLDGMGFAPFGRVIQGIEVVEKLYNGYGEGAPDGRGPDQMRIKRDGNAYLNRSFPRLDSIITARIIKD